MLLSIWEWIDFWRLETWSTILEILQYGTAFWILYLCTIHSTNMTKKSEFTWTADTKTIKFVWFVVAAILSIVFTFLGKRVDERIARLDTFNIGIRNKFVTDSIATANTRHIDYLDSARNIAMSQYHLQYVKETDSNTGLLVYKVSLLESKLDNKDFGVFPKEEIRFTILGNDNGSPNPKFTKIKGSDTVIFKLILSNVGQTLTLVNSVKYRLIQVVNNVPLLLYSFPEKPMRKDDYSKDGMEYVITKNLNISIFRHKSENVYLAIKIYYKNTSGTLQESICRFYLLNEDNIGKAQAEMNLNGGESLDKIMTQKQLW